MVRSRRFHEAEVRKTSTGGVTAVCALGLFQLGTISSYNVESHVSILASFNTCYGYTLFVILYHVPGLRGSLEKERGHTTYPSVFIVNITITILYDYA